MSQFSRRERQILDILYKLDEATSNEIRAEMDEAPTDATVRTILRILEEKAAVTHRVEGKKFVYRTRTRKASAGKSALRRVLNVFYGGSLQDALAAHLSDPKTFLNEETIDQLRELIERAETESVNQTEDSRKPSSKNQVKRQNQRKGKPS